MKVCVQNMCVSFLSIPNDHILLDLLEQLKCEENGRCLNFYFSFSAILNFKNRQIRKEKREKNDFVNYCCGFLNN